MQFLQHVYPHHHQLWAQNLLYEGRLIDKLQNSAIPLIHKI